MNVLAVVLPILVLGGQLVPYLLDSVPLYIIIVDAVLAHTCRQAAAPAKEDA